ncbi:lipoprotein-releasing system ATP-binding protein LolD [Allostella sp. ATCC 35155]|nr:lipoprotein-releasing system ATP-binding protein LolD [Stella sp. ATCC 35155]
MAEILVLEAVRKSYGIGTPVETEVLHGIDLAVRAGEFLAIIGPSGSGKSTLLNIIGLLDRPTSGRLVIDGTDTTGLGDGDRTRLRGRTIGFVFQHHYLISAFTALENVMMPMIVDRGRADPAMARRAEELLGWMDLERWRNNRVNNLSGGQQQRVAVARALALDPPLVLADEPTGNLDTAAAEGVFARMRRINRERGTTFLLVTHNLALAERCDRIVEVVDGRIAAEPAGAHAGPAAG